MNFAKNVFKILVLKWSRWQLAALWDTVWIEQASILKSGAERRLAQRCHGNRADLDLSVLMFRYVLCRLFSFHVWSRAGNFLFLFFSSSNSTSFYYLSLFFCCLRLSSVSLFFYFRLFSTVTCPLLSRYWKCVWTYYTFILVELLV